MTIQTKLVDGHGSGNRLKINSEGELHVVVHPHPPEDENISSIPFIQNFSTSAGATSMLVNGSTTNVEFSVNADPLKDLYIKTVSVAIVDASASLSKFGNLTALTNGVQLKWETRDLGEVYISSSIKTNFEFMRLALGNPNIGDNTTVFQATNVVSTSEAYMPIIDFTILFGLQYGIRLRKNTTDKISFIIRDNVSTLDQFDAIAYGIKI